jgi:hypothetical protein
MQKLITRFFEISDINDPESGKYFADELFTPDGVLQMNERMIYRGSEGENNLNLLGIDVRELIRYLLFTCRNHFVSPEDAPSHSLSAAHHQTRLRRR